MENLLNKRIQDGTRVPAKRSMTVAILENAPQLDVKTSYLIFTTKNNTVE